MLHKVKKYLRRSGALLSSFVLVLCCIISPVSADSFENDVSVNLLDYGTILNTTGNSMSFDSSDSYSLSFGNVFWDLSVYDVDMLFHLGGEPLDSLMLVTADDMFELEIEELWSGYYRAYGSLDGARWADVFMELESSGYTELQFYQINLSFIDTVSVPGHGDITLSALGFAEDYTYNSGTSVPLPQEDYGDPMRTILTAYVFPAEWYKYDYIEFSVMISGYGFNGISAMLTDGTQIPMDVSYLDGTETVSIHNANIRLDLTGIPKVRDEHLRVEIEFLYNGDARVDFGLYDAVNLIDTSVAPSTLGFLGRILDALNRGFGTGEYSGKGALKEQEIINKNVNNQLVGAVEDWNTHIEIVESGYDLAFTKTTPALNWLASLANGIYAGLGWFGRLYLLIGLISVFMLILRKSGLAHKGNDLVDRGDF